MKNWSFIFAIFFLLFTGYAFSQDDPGDGFEEPEIEDPSPGPGNGFDFPRRRRPRFDFWDFYPGEDFEDEDDPYDNEISINYIAKLKDGETTDRVTERIQRKYGGKVVILEEEAGTPVDILEVLEQEDIGEYLSSRNILNKITCAPENLEEGENSNLKVRGMMPLPPKDPSWYGRAKGGCSIVSTMMCNRILGLTKPGTPVTKKEWNWIARKIKTNKNGKTRDSDVAKYYVGKKYCVQYKWFTGSKKSYREAKKKKDKGCDLKLSFAYKKRAPGKWILLNGHTNVILDIKFDANGIGFFDINDEGKPGTISGGRNRNFRHSKLAGPILWPRNSTTVHIMYVCKCPTLWQRIGSLFD